MACPSCGAEVESGQQFCTACGVRVESRPQRGDAASFDVNAYRPGHLAERIRSEGSALEGERKQVTVLFADVLESMQLASQVGAEEWRSVIDGFLSLLCDGVHRFEGTVNKFTGDGIMALFGAPLAHEDHARRGCYAALQLRDELAGYADTLRRERGLNFSVRISLNSGEVIVGAVGDDLNIEYTAIGNTVGLASRVEQLAEPGRVYVTAATAREVEGFFGLRELGAFEIKGIDAPVAVFELTGVGAARTRVEASRERGLTRFVGRDHELGVLEAALERGHERGTGQIVGVVADPGLGKTRLCYEFAERCRSRGLEVIEGRGVAHGRRIPLLPALEMMRGYFGIVDGDGDRAARDKIAGRLLVLDDGFKELLPVLFDFLGVPDPALPPPTSPEARQRQLLAAVRRMIELGGRRNRVVLIVEDLHWLDPGTEMFLANVIEALPQAPSLLLVNFRPEYHAEWMRKSNYQQVPLAPLGTDAIAELLEDLVGSDPSLEGLGELIQERTRGNPFYIEEVVQELVESGSLTGTRGAYRLVRPVKELAIPATVQAVLEARIDRLGEREKAVLQTASVIGREFSESVLARVVDEPGPELARILGALTASEFLYERTLYPEAEYSFKHPLTEEVAYRSQLDARRTRMHAAVARAIPDAHPDRCDELAAVVADHWERADNPLEAARWHARAAAWAGQNHPADALRHSRSVRSLARELPDTDETAQLRLTACVSILQFGGWRMGMPEGELGEVYADGRAAAERLNQPRELGPMIYFYGTARGFLGHVEEAIAMHAEGRALAEQTDDRELLGLSVAYYWLFLAGRLADALAHAEEVVEITRADPNLGRDIFGYIPHAAATLLRGSILAEAGRLHEARAPLDEALELARAYDDAETLGWTLATYPRLAWLSGDPGDSLARAREGAEIAERLGSSFSLIVASWGLAYAHGARGEWQEARNAAERALEEIREAHIGLQWEAATLVVLAEAISASGDHGAAADTAEQAIDLARGGNARVNAIEAHVVLAHALRGRDGARANERIVALLADASTLAAETGARSHLPRIHLELAELATDNDDHEPAERHLREAHRLYEEIGATGHADRIATRLAALPA